MNNLLMPHKTPLKCECPSLEFDITSIIKNLFLGEEYYPFPERLQRIENIINFYNDLNPVASSFDTAYRIYILDQRLNLIFACFTNQGDIPQFCDLLSRQYASSECYTFSNLTPSNKREADYIMRAVKKLEFTPYDSLNSPTLVISYDANPIYRLFHLTHYQATLITEKFHEYNMVDWDTILSKIEFLPVIKF